ncbi:hypothetical protein [Pedobacter nutrimenti]|jgi:hypothetical protein|uniref:Uncharacterized protein n=1 Tax=Pedobacter nutrimenti TaxID=1241337 RepID=A0A318UFI5_9SPHI|nr:hypothetical protein [Pedobacter nutrimenti]PYF75126.1 hypothetical protein B0O44_103575 [Pedobacter nutrimenti]
MEYAIQLLEKEKKLLERSVKEEDLMHKNMQQATQNLKNIASIKRAIKLLKLKAQQGA